jgi:hypothetical protein
MAQSGVVFKTTQSGLKQLKVEPAFFSFSFSFKFFFFKKKRFNLTWIRFVKTTPNKSDSKSLYFCSVNFYFYFFEANNYTINVKY